MGIGWTEIVLILVIALVVLGPAKFPSAARKMGRLYREIREAVSTVEKEVASAGAEEDRREAGSGTTTPESVHGDAPESPAGAEPVEDGDNPDGPGK